MDKKFKIKISGIVVLIFFCLSFTLPAVAQKDLTLTITPPLVKINMQPGETWSSTIKLVNNNNEDMPIYAQTLDFKSGEEGGVEFIKNNQIDSLTAEEKRFLLSQWLNIDVGPYEIPAQKSLEVPYTITVPENAEAGGHYAAILLGVRPDEDIKGTVLKVSSLLASLIMVNIQGDIIESGQIREFSTDKRNYQEPQVAFTLRFQNTGNVHLQPQGEIAIYDMFNKEVDRITINHASEFGNVLPKSIRKWNFNWEGEGGILNMGRYRAMLVLTYGEQAHETVDQTLYFWVLNIKILLTVLGAIALLILLIVFFIRLYINRAVKATQRAAGLIMPSSQPQSKISVIPESNNHYEIKEAMIKQKDTAVNKNKKPIGLGWSAVKKILGLIIIILAVIIGALYFTNKNREEIELKAPPLSPSSDVIIEEINDEEAKIEVIGDLIATSTEFQATTTDEELNSDLSQDSATTASEVLDTNLEDSSDPEISDKDKVIIKILNGSGIPGQANKAKELLKANEFTNTTTGNADSFDYSTTLIKYSHAFSKTAEEISSLFKFMVELEEVSEQTEDIVIIIGRDYE